MPFPMRFTEVPPSREPSAKRQALRSQRSPAQQIANPTALALISARHFGQKLLTAWTIRRVRWSQRADGYRLEYDRIEYGGLPVLALKMLGPA